MTLDSMRAWVRNYDAMDLWEKGTETACPLGAVHDIEQACASISVRTSSSFRRLGPLCSTAWALGQVFETPSLPPPRRLKHRLM